MIPGVVDMHMETLEAVLRESKRLPKVQKVCVNLQKDFMGSYVPQ